MATLLGYEFKLVAEVCRMVLPALLTVTVATFMFRLLIHVRLVPAPVKVRTGKLAVDLRDS
jgi:hypothetical protein